MKILIFGEDGNFPCEIDRVGPYRQAIGRLLIRAAAMGAAIKAEMAGEAASEPKAGKRGGSEPPEFSYAYRMGGEESADNRLTQVNL